MTQILIGIIALVAIPLLFLWWLKTAADNKQQASYVRQGTVEFVVAGQRLLRILENTRDEYWCEGEYSYQTKVGKMQADGTWKLEPLEIPVKRAIVPGEKNYKYKGWYKWTRHELRSRWGFYWVSAFYPLRKIHQFKIPKVRLSRGYTSGEPLEKWLERDTEMSIVSALQVRVPRPVLISDVEFKNGLKMSIGVFTSIKFVVPEIPVFTYAGEFFQMYEESIQGSIINLATGMELDKFVNEFPKGPDSDFFAKILSQLNRQLITQLGIEIETAYIAAIEMGDSDQKKALEDRELKRLQGEAVVVAAQKAAEAKIEEAKGKKQATITEAEGEASAIEKVGQARAEAYRKLVKATGGTPEVAMALLRKEGLEAFRGQTLVEGGASAGVMLNTGGGNQPPSQPPQDQGGGNPRERKPRSQGQPPAST